jgi:putative SOS response-associated peptidase YedK
MPVELFLEWMNIHGPGGKPAEGQRQPYVIAMAHKGPFSLPTLWESWTDGATGMIARTFAFVTCPANNLIAEIRDRMPVIIAPESREQPGLQRAQRGGSDRVGLEQFAIW